MRTHQRLYDRFGYGGVDIGNKPPPHNLDQHDLVVEYVGMFAGRGALGAAARNLGGDIVMLIEKGPVARAMLNRKFPEPQKLSPPATASPRSGETDFPLLETRRTH